MCCITMTCAGPYVAGYRIQPTYEKNHTIICEATFICAIVYSKIGNQTVH